ncbi:MAG: A/G-specific adenine glycosylase [Rubellimicrobium sp.]|nr:A/G-specific adenine glycosylase [Rubellimicrobium sp.]
MDTADIGTALLRWYDGAARVLPWRVPPALSRQGVRPDPYHVWLSEVMLQQTTVEAVRPRFARFVTRWPALAALAAADEAGVMGEWAGLGYYARARNLIACAGVVMRDHGGTLPQTRDGLLTLPGIGPYTAAAIAAIAFDAPETVVDGNVERVMARLFDVQAPLPGAKRALAALAATLTPQARAGDHAQALMDLGATICTPRAPDCGACPLVGYCAAFARGTAADLPRRQKKAARPLRRGLAYVGRRADGALLLETRAKAGLLGGMTGWPGSDWTDDPVPAPPVPGDWRQVAGEVRHVFTHFELRLAVFTARLPPDCAPLRGAFVPSGDFDADTLPTVMRKVWELACKAP